MRRAAFAMLVLSALPAGAGEVVVVAAEAARTGETWRFDVTLRHADTGWDHYADAWAVLAPDGTQLGFRELLHPHVTEQPFTRALSGVRVPGALDEVIIRAHDSVHGWGEAAVTVRLR
jgi:hypothetical protein